MNLFLEVFKILLRFLLPVLIIILILTIINIILNYRKYGTKIFSSFKRYNLNGTMKDLVIDIIKNESHKEILILDRDKDSFFVITHYNVFSIFIFDFNGSVDGKIEDKTFKCGTKEILNPIPELLTENQLIGSKGINIKTIFINSKKDVKINIVGLENIYTLKDISYDFYQLQHSNIKYSKDEMLNFYKIIDGVINGNN